MGSLRRKLDKIRRERGGKPRQILRPTNHGKIGESRFTNGIEHPTILGLRWLTYFAEALRLHRVVWNWRVDASRWEQDGCVGLHLQRPVHRNVSAPRITAGFGLVTKETVPVAIGGGVWEAFRIPTGLINNHDIPGLLKRVMEPKQADIVTASSAILRAMQGH